MVFYEQRLNEEGCTEYQGSFERVLVMTLV